MKKIASPAIPRTSTLSLRALIEPAIIGIILLLESKGCGVVALDTTMGLHPFIEPAPLITEVCIRAFDFFWLLKLEASKVSVGPLHVLH